MKLIQYRDTDLPTYTYFWISKDDHVLSPYFDTAEEAEYWLELQNKTLTPNQKDS
jgi:hypothetical protein